MTLTLPDDLAAKLEALARHQNRSPEDELRDLLATAPTPPPKTKKRRTPGLGRGTIWVSDDFDDELGDDFWLGKDDPGDV